MKKKVSPVRVRVTEADPKCGAGHYVGQEWIWEDTAPSGLCSSVFQTCYNAYLGLRFGGKEPEAEMIHRTQPDQPGYDGYTNKDSTLVYRRCPDPNIRVVVSLERMDGEEVEKEE